MKKYIFEYERVYINLLFNIKDIIDIKGKILKYFSITVKKREFILFAFGFLI